MILPYTQPNSMSKVNFHIKGFHIFFILCSSEFVACNSLPFLFPYKLLRCNLCIPRLNQKCWKDCSGRDLMNTFAICNEKRKKPSNKGSNHTFLLYKLIIKFNVFGVCMKNRIYCHVKFT